MTKRRYSLRKRVGGSHAAGDNHFDAVLEQLLEDHEASGVQERDVQRRKKQRLDGVVVPPIPLDCLPR